MIPSCSEEEEWGSKYYSCLDIEILDLNLLNNFVYFHNLRVGCTTADDANVKIEEEVKESKWMEGYNSVKRF